MANFKVKSEYSPAGDQEEAINCIVNSIKSGNVYQTLLGVTGSGKTYTMAKSIEQTGLPTLIMTHNKTLAAQLFSEFTNFFPNAHVEYFVSYYDYYQPEAYIPRSDLFIEKDSSINDELERMRLSTTTSLLNYDNVIVIASVSANYGLGDPNEYAKMVQLLEIGMEISQQKLLRRLVDMGYSRNDTFFDRGNIRVVGDVVDIYPTYNNEEAVRIEFFGDNVEAIYSFDMTTNKKISSFDKTTIFATSQFIVGKERLAKAIQQIEIELQNRLLYYAKENNMVAYQRLKQRVEFDLEMLTATGACKGIENYSRHLTGKSPGQTPNTLLDYFDVKHKKYLVIVDESHVSLPQYRGMYAADKSRKEVLVEYGFRLPSALDNRPFKYDEYIIKAPHYLFVSATPTDIELNLSSTVAEQIVRPTGLLDPLIEIRPIKNQVEDIHDEIKEVIKNNERVLITTLTKKMSEALTKYLSDLDIKVAYLHSDIDTIQRTQIIRQLRLGTYDVLIGINLLREGLDIPEVSRVAILDADKEGFLRSQTALIQTMGRAARNANGKVIMYADRITKSIQKALDVTNHRRKKQIKYNLEHNIIPTTVKRTLDQDLSTEDASELYSKMEKANKIPKSERKILIQKLAIKMKQAAKDLEFEEAAKLRDEIAKLKKL